jgi:hypothetical protein
MPQILPHPELLVEPEGIGAEAAAPPMAVLAAEDTTPTAVFIHKWEKHI